MNANPSPDDMNEELMTRWIDGQLNAVEKASVDRLLSDQPSLFREKDAAQRLGGLLRGHLPSTMEPSSPEFFTSRIMDEIHVGAVLPLTKSVQSVEGVSFWSWLRRPWFAPLASAAAVALIFASLNGSRPAAAPSMDTARIYAPDPNVVAKAFYSESAEATVIDLQGLTPVPDDQEIRAFDLASSEPTAPGQPQVFYAAAHPGRAVLVVSSGADQVPRMKTIY